jgi:branched-subunit amino acid transport protein
MNTTAIWLAIIGVGLTGIVTRCSFLFLGDRLRLPPAVEKALRHAPAAALAATVAPGVWVLDSGWLGAVENPRFLAALVAGVVMWMTRGMLWSMAAGVAVYTALRLLVAA